MAALALALALTGCAEQLPEVMSPPENRAEPPSIETTNSDLLPADDPYAVREDEGGLAPDDAVLAYVDAIEQRDWRSAYSMTASPGVDYPDAEREWREASERYEAFAVREVRVADDATAYVRVTYEAWTTPPGGDPYAVTVERPGEWWSVHKVAGHWKVAWLPRQ